MQIIVLFNSINIIEDGFYVSCTKSTCNLLTELPWYKVHWDRLNSERITVVKILLLILSDRND
jgi:hypothetical protein